MLVLSILIVPLGRWLIYSSDGSVVSFSLSTIMTAGVTTVVRCIVRCIALVNFVSDMSYVIARVGLHIIALQLLITTALQLFYTPEYILLAQHIYQPSLNFGRNYRILFITSVCNSKFYFSK